MVYHDFVGNWFSHSSKKFRRVTLHFSENLLYRKRFRIGGEYHDFLWKFFCLRVSKEVPKRTLLFQNTSGLKKLHRMVYHDFVGNWFSHNSEKFRRGTLLFSENFFYRKFFVDRKAISRFSLKIFLSQSTEKFS